MYRDHYDILEIDPEATAEAVASAYRCAVWNCHPDLHPGDEEALARFHKLQQAYETLSDPAKRELYDDLDSRPKPRPVYWAAKSPKDPLRIVKDTRCREIRVTSRRKVTKDDAGAVWLIVAVVAVGVVVFGSLATAIWPS